MTTVSTRGDWFVYILGGAVIVAVAAAVASAAITVTPTEPAAPTQTVAEQRFLHLIGGDTYTDQGQKDALWLGHNACTNMNSIEEYAGVRTAVGQLMSAQEPPAYAKLLVESALTSGMCAEQQ